MTEASAFSLFPLPRTSERRALGAAFAFLGLIGAAPLCADDATDQKPKHQIGFELKGHYRDSDLRSVLSPFPFQPAAFLETVDPGEHFELSVVTLWYKGHWDNGLSAKVKLDLIDKYDRNPTSEDHEYDLDEAWIRWGEEVEPGQSHEGFSLYAKLGKIPKFERQDDRHLESYGLISTAFNRAEDVGLELGFDLGSVLYVKTSLTQGNPVFIRDPTALAGDNGTSERLRRVPPPRFGTGQVIFYDADVEDLDFDNPEAGLGLGARLGSSEGTWSLDVLLWGFRRDLAETIEFDGTFYGGDLDLLLGPFDRSPLPITNGQKEEFGANIWLYAGSFSFFGQYVDQDLAGLPRKGWEAEIAYEFELPYLGALFGRQVLPYIAPAIRYSDLEPDFVTGQFPAVSVRWLWDKTDYGVRIGLLTGLDLTVEYTENEFIVRGNRLDNNEFLATLRFNWDWRR